MDPFVARLEELDDACTELVERLQRLGDAIHVIRSMREEGHRVSEIVASGPGPTARRDVRASWSRVNVALHSYRAHVVRVMIDEEGMSVAETARLTGNARQVVSRLYHSA